MPNRSNRNGKTQAGQRKSVGRGDDSIVARPRYDLTNLTNSYVWPIIKGVETKAEGDMASTQVNLYEAKTQLSSLVERVANGEEFVIAKAGKPMAKLVALSPEPKQPRKPGKNLLGITYIAEDFDAPLPEDVLKDFGL